MISSPELIINISDWLPIVLGVIINLKFNIKGEISYPFHQTILHYCCAKATYFQIKENTK